MYKLYEPSEHALDILFQDAHFVAIDKPSGLLVHRSNIDKYETHFAMQMLRDQINQHVYPVHRLDKPTSGVLLFALSSEAAKRAQCLFIERRIHKTYQALVRGFTPDSQTICHPVNAILNSKKNKQPKQKKPTDEDNIAETHLSTLKQFELPFMVDRYPASRYSLVALSPKTGKRHQLRYHMKHIAHPIIGDPKYGKSTHNNFFKTRFAVDHLLLSATELRFEHPFTQQAICINAKPSPQFAQLLNALEMYALPCR